MKTYKTTIEKPCLEIWNSEYNESPREWGNLGYFITVDSRYNSPDDNDELIDIVKETGRQAQSIGSHMKMIKEDYEWANSEDKIVAIYPITKYEHGGVSYSLGEKHGFDYSNNGFYILTKESVKDFGIKTDEEYEEIIKKELDLYNKYINGEVYGFTLTGEDGKEIDGGGNFYDFEDLKEHLPAEYKNEDLSEYLVEW